MGVRRHLENHVLTWHVGTKVNVSTKIESNEILKLKKRPDKYFYKPPPVCSVKIL
jgi:hypothetical protein